MSGANRRVTTRTLLRMKQEKEPIAMITAYDFPTARIAEEAGADILLVGDSLGMVVLGYDSTIPVTLEDMLHHTKAVSRGANRAMVVADMPFMTAHLSGNEALRAAARLMQEGGAYGVKMEGGLEILSNVKTFVSAGIPVMGHLGLTPQSVNQLGGYRVQGKDEATARRLLDDARRLEEAGVFSLVLECVPEELAGLIAEHLAVPVIGIGAGRHVDGQVLVFHDLLGIPGGWHPSFVKVYRDAGQVMREGVAEYVREVKTRRFPEEGHSSHISGQWLAHLYGSEKETGSDETH
jgi:3-methyl-2-oxobutanoate hydroxymethyltransferase